MARLIYKYLSLFVLTVSSIYINSCNNQDILPTPDKVGTKTRSKIFSRNESVEAINKLHGLSVAAQNNIIAEYGIDQKDLLYVSFYQNSDSAVVAFNEMIKKIAHNKKGPFYHLVQLNEAGENAFFLMGMGASHYVFISANFIIWFQTYQSFGKEIPESILNYYPPDPISKQR
jgi:hypothetical protein